MCEFYYSVGCDEYALNGFKKIFKMLFENNNGMLIHCSLGRDRAGMTIALIQRVLSFDLDSIVDDYLYTNECRNITNPISYNYSHALKEYILSFF